MIRTLAAFTLVFSVVSPAWAQTPGTQPASSKSSAATSAKNVTATNETSIADAYIDFSIPDVAALGVFDVNPNRVTRPGNLKELSLAVLPLAAGYDQIGAGIAFSWAPVYTFIDSVEGYQTSLLRRLSFSGATTKDSKTLRRLCSRWCPHCADGSE
jgi:hypothetical protein